MEQAVHQTLINDIETLLASNKGIDEAQAKSYRKSAESLIEQQQDHPLNNNLNSCIEQLRERIHQQVEKRDKDYKQAIAELKIARAALKDEKLQEAEKATQKALSIVGQIPSLSDKRRAKIDKHLDKIYPHMRKLSAWRHWGTTQARENLIDQIKQIPGSRMDPNQIVKTLRDAKAQWQEWEKTGDHSEHKLWKEFSNACDTAYEPCREHFKEQKEIRKKNLLQKRELIEEINTRYEKTDWSHPDWKDIDKWVRQTRGRFFKIGHTDYKQHKKLRARLDEALDKIESHLSRERERSLKNRHQLIEDINALDQVEDMREAINRLEEIKKQWVVTVLAKRSIENKLWDNYQKAQNTIYEKRNSERKEQDQLRNEHLKQKRQIVEELLKAAGASAEELLAGQSVLAQFRDRFNEVGYVPRKAEKALMDSWRKAQKQFSTALGNAQKSKAKANQNTLLEKARLCARLEQQKLQGETIDAGASATTFKALPELSGALEKTMQQRLDEALNEKPWPQKKVEDNTAEQLTRCMKCEVILDLETPGEYTQQRMAFQIERLSASMKKNTQAQEKLEDLRQALLTTGPVEQQHSDTIWARIENISKAN